MAVLGWLVEFHALELGDPGDQGLNLLLVLNLGLVQLQALFPELGVLLGQLLVSAV